MTPATTQSISQNWYWKKRNPDDCPALEHELTLPVGDDYTQQWVHATQFPSEVHVELLNKKLIPDPFIGFGEHQVQWIADAEWLYKTTFQADPPSINGFASLEFQGLDTICDIYLNGILVLECLNMFRTYIYEICHEAGNLGRLRGDNTLLLHFKSAKKYALEQEKSGGMRRAGSYNLGHPSRLYLRKAQYDWRWDWGPELMTCGPYRPIALRTYSTRIQDIYPRVFITPSIDLKIDAELKGCPSRDIKTLVFTLKTSDGSLILQERRAYSSEVQSQLVALDGFVHWTDLQQKGVELWWPVGYGKQVLYNLELAILDENEETIDAVTRRFGFRSVALVQELLSKPDQHGLGTTFLFEVNGIRMFMGGSNWIPADNFFTRITDERYRQLLTLARDGNHIMIRVWGGGIYEPDIFYDICDELGLLVWQDFQFACGIYPAHDEFVATVSIEAEQNVRRLRHHPCIALFCGNNEDYQQILQWNEPSVLPARILYEKVFPEIVERLTDPPVPYHRGSPYGGKDWDTTDPTIGDVHIWDIWGGRELPYQQYEKLGGRFISEFGLPSYPSMRTIQHWMGNADQDQWHPQSPLISQHIRAGSFERRFAIVMNENFRISEDLETYAFRTQVMQAEGVGLAYRSWKQGWSGVGSQFTGGVLVWQLNDCWPGVSWSIIDYFLRPKPVYYTIARILKPISLHITRKVIKNRANDRPEQFYEFGATQSTQAILTISGVSTLPSTITSATLSITFHALQPQQLDHPPPPPPLTYPNTRLDPNTSRIFTTFSYPECPTTTTATSSHNIVICARLIDPDTHTVLARYTDWPQPFKFISFPTTTDNNNNNHPIHTTLKRDIDKHGSASLTLSVSHPIKSLFFSLVVTSTSEDSSDSAITWSDNHLDLVPDDSQHIHITNLGSRKIQMAYLGCEKPRVVPE